MSSSTTDNMNELNVIDEPYARRVEWYRKSLLYNENETLPFSFLKHAKHTSNDDQHTRITNLFKHGHGCGSVFLDITGQNIDKVSLLQEIAKQYPTRIGVLTQQTGNTEYAEINFDLKDKALDTILEKGVIFDERLLIIPSRAIDENFDIIYLSLYSLPFMAEKPLSETLEETISPYGDILDLGIFLESTTMTYMCTGYAILNISSEPNTNPYRALTHKIECPKSKLGSFYAVWDKMPNHCQFCHVQDHSTDACPNKDSNEILWESKKGDIEAEQEEGFTQYIHFLLKKKGREYINLEVKGKVGNITRPRLKRRTGPGSNVVYLHYA